MIQVESCFRDLCVTPPSGVWNMWLQPISHVTPPDSSGCVLLLEAVRYEKNVTDTDFCWRQLTSAIITNPNLLVLSA